MKRLRQGQTIFAVCNNSYRAGSFQKSYVRKLMLGSKNLKPTPDYMVLDFQENENVVRKMMQIDTGMRNLFCSRKKARRAAKGWDIYLGRHFR